MTKSRNAALVGGNTDKFAAAVSVVVAKPVTCMDLVDELDIKYDTARAWLRIMERRKLVKQEGLAPVSKGTPAKVYRWAHKPFEVVT